MTRRGIIIICCVLLLFACLFLPHAAPSASTTLPKSRLNPMDTMVAALNTYGFNAGADAGAGGLWLSWRTGSAPLQTNFTMDGMPTTSGTPQYDRLLNLRYLVDLWRYTTKYPHASSALAMRTRFTAIIRRELAVPTLTDVTAYADFIDLAQLSHDLWYQQQAQDLVTNAVIALYHPSVGAIYWTALPDMLTGHSDGWYRTDWVIALIAAMTREGVRRNKPDWIADGRRALTFLDTHAALPSYGVYLQRLGGVLLSTGIPNPNEPILRPDDDGYMDDGGVIRGEAVGQEICAFLSAYQADHDAVLLLHATQLLTALTPLTTQLGIWDFAHQGYEQVQFAGLDALHPGNPFDLTGAKVALDQEWLLAASQQALATEGSVIQPLMLVLQHLLLTDVYDATHQGVIERLAADWTLLTIHGQSEDWISAAATVMALDCLLTQPTSRGSLR